MVQHEVAAPLSSLRQRHESRGQRLLTLARRKPLGAVAVAIIIAFLLVALLADVIAPYSAYESFSGHRLEGPSGQFWFGTDQFSRDNFSRIVAGSRISLIVGVSSVLLGTTIGTVLGLISGYWEGRFDLIFQRFMDAMMAFPNIILAMVIVGVLGPSVFNVILAIGVTGIPRTNRVVRGSVLAEKPRPYIDAAKCIGCDHKTILFRHLLPNVTAPIIIISTVTLGTAIVAEASLSFLGLGVPPPEPSWGGMIARDVRKFLLVQPWLAVWPGLALSLVVLGWNLLGDALRDIWDPRLRGT